MLDLSNTLTYVLKTKPGHVIMKAYNAGNLATLSYPHPATDTK